MSIYNIMRGGGLKNPNLFLDKTQEQGNPFPATIADEYRRGHYALSSVYNPHLIGYQNTVANDHAFTAGDMLLVAYIPALGALDQGAVYVRGDENFDGATIEVSYAKIVDGEVDDTTITALNLVGTGGTAATPDLGATGSYLITDKIDASVDTGYAIIVTFGGSIADTALKLSEFSGSIGVSVGARVFPCVDQL